MEMMTMEQVTNELKRLSDNVADLRDELRRREHFESRKENGIVEYPTDHPHIYTNPEMHSGQPTIRGTGITVRNIVESVRVGYTVEELLEAYPLTRAQVHDALSYYYDHKDEIEKIIKQNEEALWRLTNRASTSPSTPMKT